MIILKKKKKEKKTVYFLRYRQRINLFKKKTDDSIYKTERFFFLLNFLDVQYSNIDYLFPFKLFTYVMLHSMTKQNKKLLILI